MCSSPAWFAVSITLVAVYVLCAWSALSFIPWRRIGWQDHYLLIDLVPTAPKFHIPFLGEPSTWTLIGSTTAFTLMSIAWVGAVVIFEKRRDP